MCLFLDDDDDGDDDADAGDDDDDGDGDDDVDGDNDDQGDDANDEDDSVMAIIMHKIQKMLMFSKFCWDDVNDAGESTKFNIMKRWSR